MIGIVIPTRGDRSVFLNKCLEMMGKQTKKIDLIHVVSEEPKSEDKDITYRYRKGLEHLFKQGCEVVFLIEDDDWYSPKYIETMYTMWLQFKKPEILGLGDTIYYHLPRKEYTVMKHPNRSSAFSTMVTEAVLDIEWPEDNYSFLDIKLWEQLKGQTFVLNRPICMGIKHGMGVCGGRGHNNDFKYEKKDYGYAYLSMIVGEDAKYYKDLTLHKIV